MNYYLCQKKFIHFSMCLLVWVVFVGCKSPQEYKADADKRVYDIVEEKWDDDFGNRSNYKISDTEAGPNDIQIGADIVADVVLDLTDAVKLATAQNRRYQLQKEMLYASALDLRLARHEFEPRFFGGGREGYGKEGSSEGVGGEADIGFERLFSNGARVGTKIGMAWFSVLTGDIRSGLASILSATVSVPLLRGSSREVVMENLTQAERDTLYQIRSFNRFRKTFVVEVVSEYYQVLELFDAVKNAENNYNTLVDLYVQVEELANAGDLPLLELERVRQEKLNARDRYIQAKKEYELALDGFKLRQLSLPANREIRLDVSELDALRSVELSGPEFSESDAIEAALARRLDVANRDDAIVDAKRKVAVAADGLRGELNLFAGVDASSLSGSSELPGAGALDDDFTADRGRSNPMRRMRDNNPLRSFRDESVIGIDGELPLDRVAEQNIYRKALITVNQRRRDYEEICDSVTFQVRQSYRDLKAAAERYQVHSEELALAKKRFDKDLLLLKYGMASSRRVLNAQGDLFNAENAATEAIVGFTIATLNFYRDTGVLGVRADGMWAR